jgi:hypothetical protein
MKEEFKEGSKGPKNPLRAFARASSGRIFSSLTPKD